MINLQTPTNFLVSKNSGKVALHLQNLYTVRMKVKIKREEIEKALAEYEVGTLEASPQEIRGDTNLNFKIFTSTGPYFLKYIQDTNELPLFEYLGDLHQQLLLSEVTVPRIYKNKQGKYVTNRFQLYKFIDGESKKEWSEKELMSVARNFAHLHNALEKITVPEIVKNKTDDFVKAESVSYVRENIMPKLEKLTTDLYIKEEIAETLRILKKSLVGYETLPKHIIHGDLNESNALFKQSRNVAVLDITLKNEALVYDLGIFLYWWCFPWWTKRMDLKRLEILLTAYEQVRRLTRREKILLPYLILRRSFLDLTLPVLRYYRGALNKKELGDTLQGIIVRNQEIRACIPQILENIL